jgi:hypothetical protein
MHSSVRKEGQRSQGGAKFPTGGIRDSSREPASAFVFLQAKGQQTWCDARADGHSPDERETRSMSCRIAVLGRAAAAFSRALILATTHSREP